ncbi:MAG: hypothetical protein IJ083_07765 [Clostridia bacterium]|nr:hypothetical protein [Clostridia bacterium]
MSEVKEKKPSGSRKWTARILTLVVLIAIAAWMFVIGRGHTVYFDNKTLELENGESIGTLQRVDVYVNGNRVARLAKRERGMATWIGQNFKMTLEITKEKGDEPYTQEVAIDLPYSLDGIVVNLPGYLAGRSQDEWMSEFVPVASSTTEEDEEIITDEFGLGDM